MKINTVAFYSKIEEAGRSLTRHRLFSSEEQDFKEEDTKSQSELSVRSFLE
jgi:hypothetical protein